MGKKIAAFRRHRGRAGGRLFAGLAGWEGFLVGKPRIYEGVQLQTRAARAACGFEGVVLRRRAALEASPARYSRVRRHGFRRFETPKDSQSQPNRPFGVKFWPRFPMFAGLVTFGANIFDVKMSL